jgi:hypothetical protein
MRKRMVTMVVTAVVGLFALVFAGAAPAYASRGAAYELVNTATGKCGDVAGQSTSAGAVVHEWTCANDDNQLWIPVDLGTGFILYENLNSVNHGKFLCLAVRGGSTVFGTIVDQEPCNRNSLAQWWHWQPEDNIGNLALRSGLGDVCLALWPYSSSNGTKIAIDGCMASPPQTWHAG